MVTINSLVESVRSEAQARMTQYNYSSGVHTIFWAVTKDIGVRLYRKREHAQLSYSAQRLAWKAGVGPELFGGTVHSVTITEIVNRYELGKFCSLTGTYPNRRDWTEEVTTTYWFYFTEIIHQLGTSFLHTLVYEDRMPWYKMVDESVSLLKTKGFKITDTHSGNWGVKDDKIIIIDFSNVIWDWESKGSKAFQKLEPALV